MVTLFKKFKWLQILLGSLIVVGGGLIIGITLAKNSKDAANEISGWLSFIIAFGFFAFGILTIIPCVKLLDKEVFKSSLFVSAILIALGVVLIVHKTLLSDMLALFLAVLVISIGAIFALNSTFFIVYKRPIWLIIIFYMIAAILITGGILIITFKEEVKVMIFFICGVFIVAYGIYQIVEGIRLLKAVEKVEVIVATVDSGEAKENEEPENLQPEVKQIENNTPEITQISSEEESK